jgi:hypothetical protein
MGAPVEVPVDGFFGSPILMLFFKDQVLGCPANLVAVLGKHCDLAGADLNDSTSVRLEPVRVNDSYPIANGKFPWSAGLLSRVGVVPFAHLRNTLQ